METFTCDEQLILYCSIVMMFIFLKNGHVGSSSFLRKTLLNKCKLEYEDQEKVSSFC